MNEDQVFDFVPFYTPKDKKFSVDEISKKRLLVFLSVSVVAFICLFIFRSVQLQVVDYYKYKNLSDDNRFLEFVIPAERGAIFDRNGEILARNKPAFSIQMNTRLCVDAAGKFDKCFVEVETLKKLIPFDDTKIIEEINKNNTNILILSGLSKEQILPIDSNIDKFSSISISSFPVREYPYGEAFAHVLGYVGLSDSLSPVIVGKTGVEQFYNKYLSGIPGSQIVESDSLGGHFKQIDKRDAFAGRNLKTYLDKDLQVLAYDLLKTKLDDPEAKSTGGAIIAQDPTTGGVLAMVSYPSFDPTKMSNNISPEELSKLNTDERFPFFNRVIAAVYPPGSTFKMVMASAILMEKLVSEKYQIFDPGFISIGGSTFKNWKLDGHGDVDLFKALQVSNDTYFYTMGGGYNGVGGLGINKINKWATLFGFGQKTGIDLNGEVAGYFPDGKSRAWYLGDTYITSIGQGDVLGTILQVNQATSLFASQGKIFVPRVVNEIEGEPEHTSQIQSQGFVDDQTLAIVRDGLKLAVSPGGTGYPFFDFADKHKGLEIAGKTGTSEYYKPNGEYGTHALFTVFGPLEVKDNVKPIVLTVFIEGGGGGADDAAPIARKLMDLWFEKQGY